ncbi:MAG TPA: hypothetical protein VGZ23_18730 [bacterium]|nr:hypothetical protein [bacterium]
MEKLRTPLLVSAIYVLLIGLSTLTPGLVRAVFGYDVRDAGVLLVLSATFLGFGVVLWGIAGEPEKYGALAMSVFIALVIAIVFLLWGWLAHMFTARNVLIPVIIDIVLAAWIWSARPQS